MQNNQSTYNFSQQKNLHKKQSTQALKPVQATLTNQQQSFRIINQDKDAMTHMKIHKILGKQSIYIYFEGQKLIIIFTDRKDQQKIVQYKTVITKESLCNQGWFEDTKLYFESIKQNIQNQAQDLSSIFQFEDPFLVINFRKGTKKVFSSRQKARAQYLSAVTAVRNQICQLKTIVLGVKKQIIDLQTVVYAQKKGNIEIIKQIDFDTKKISDLTKFALKQLYRKIKQIDLQFQQKFSKNEEKFEQKTKNVFLKHITQYLAQPNELPQIPQLLQPQQPPEPPNSQNNQTPNDRTNEHSQQPILNTATQDVDPNNSPTSAIPLSSNDNQASANVELLVILPIIPNTEQIIPNPPLSENSEVVANTDPHNSE